MFVNSDWHNLFKNLNQWALNAFDEFVHNMDSSIDVNFDLSRNDNISIAIYGLPQTGKSTLLLKILGVDDVSMSKVSEVLRGGSDLGKSATIFPTRYSVSLLDDQWQLRNEAGEEFVKNDEEMTAYLAEIRQERESHDTFDLSIFSIAIPKKYISNQKPEQKFSILDLPGIDANNQKEMEFVNRLCDKYIPFADVVLLVATVDNLGFIQKENLKLNSLENWYTQPNKFKLILTRVFSDDNVKKYIRNNTIDNMLESDKMFLNYFLNETSTHNQLFKSINIDVLYPLELGKSINDLKNNDSEYFRIIEMLNDKFFDKFINSLSNTTNPYFRCQSGFDYKNVIENKIILLNEEFFLQKKQFEKKYEEVCDEIKEIELCVKHLEDDYKAFIDKFSNTMNILILYTYSYFYVRLKNMLFLKHPLLVQVESVKFLKNRIINLQIILKDNFETICEELNDIKYYNVPIFKLNEDFFIDISNKLDGYLFDKYFSSDSFISDSLLINKAFEYHVEFSANQLTESIEVFKAEIKENFDKKSKILFRNLQTYKLILSKFENDRECLMRDYCFVELDYYEILDKLKSALSHVSSFESIMEQAHNVACNKSYTDFLNETQPHKKFIKLCYYNEISKQYDILRRGVNSCE